MKRCWLQRLWRPYGDEIGGRTHILMVPTGQGKVIYRMHIARLCGHELAANVRIVGEEHQHHPNKRGIRRHDGHGQRGRRFYPKDCVWFPFIFCIQNANEGFQLFQDLPCLRHFGMIALPQGISFDVRLCAHGRHLLVAVLLRQPVTAILHRLTCLQPSTSLT